LAPLTGTGVGLFDRLLTGLAGTLFFVDPPPEPPAAPLLGFDPRAGVFGPRSFGGVIFGRSFGFFGGFAFGGVTLGVEAGLGVRVGGDDEGRLWILDRVAMAEPTS
jgi:hypothetical protein